MSRAPPHFPKSHLHKPHFYKSFLYKPLLYKPHLAKPFLYKSHSYKPHSYKIKPHSYKSHSYKPHSYKIKSHSYKPHSYKIFQCQKPLFHSVCLLEICLGPIRDRSLITSLFFRGSRSPPSPLPHVMMSLFARPPMLARQNLAAWCKQAAKSYSTGHRCRLRFSQARPFGPGLTEPKSPSGPWEKLL